MSNHDGGPAFPAYRECWPVHGDQPHLEAVPGMTLRDYFAAAALTGILSGRNDWRERGIEWEDATTLGTGLAYEFADAMLAAREATNDTPE